MNMIKIMALVSLMIPTITFADPPCITDANGVCVDNPGGGPGIGGGGGNNNNMVRFACIGPNGLLWFSQTRTVEQALANCLGAGGIGIIVAP